MKVYVFKSLPPFLWGFTRDLRVMWALEECGIAYEPIGLDCGPNGLQDEVWFEPISPFKQVPVIDDDGYILTESGAILLYLAEKSGKLIPSDLQGRAQVYRWTITSLNNIEPFTLPILFADLQGDSSPHGKLRSWNIEILERFLALIDKMLKTQPFVTGADFTVADIVLTCAAGNSQDRDLAQVSARRGLSSSLRRAARIRESPQGLRRSPRHRTRKRAIGRARINHTSFPKEELCLNPTFAWN